MSASQHPLRIAHLAFTSLPRTIGGLEVVADSLLRAQTDAGCEVRLVTRWKGYLEFARSGFPYKVLALPPNPRFHSDPLGPVGSRWPVSTAVMIHQLRHRFDIWHIHALYPAGWMAHGSLVAMGVPVVVTADGVDIETDAASGHGFRLRPIHDCRIRELIGRARCLTAISPSITDRYIELGASPERIKERITSNALPLGKPTASTLDAMILSGGTAFAIKNSLATAREL